MDMVETPCGPVPTAEPVERYGDGRIRSITPCAKVELDTPLGRLTAQYASDDVRRSRVAPVTFHEDGSLRNLALDRQRTVETPVGHVPAEQITFHPGGALKRVFPLNGRLSGYWTQEDETRLAKPMRVRTPSGPVFARLLGLCFEADGSLRSLTLWPGEQVHLRTPAGPVQVRVGMGWYPDGALRSVEPASGAPVRTPVGEVEAYDPDIAGVNGDLNSLRFGPDGAVTRVATVRTEITARLGDGSERVFSPGLRESLCGDGDREPVPMILCFDKRNLSIQRVPGEPAVLLPLDTAFASGLRSLPLDRLFAPMRCSV